jgi:3-hydroxy acid dehydrogenase/malonic semialdehyde reductase
MEDKIVCITGASSGIGWATAKAFANQNTRLILCGRRKEKLVELQKQLNVDSIQLVFDVRERKAVFEAFESLPDSWKQITILINNAGNAHGIDPVQTASIDDWDAMIDGNVKGLMYVTKAVLPKMVEVKKGQIINLGSIAGKEVYPNGSVYCSSKFAVDAFTSGLRIDLNPYKIRVGAIHPGLVETEFSQVRFKGNTDRAEKVYKGIEALSAEDIADAILYMVNTPERVNIADLVILPTQQANAYVQNRDS